MVVVGVGDGGEGRGVVV